MNKGASKDTKLSKKDKRNSFSLEEDCEIYQVKESALINKASTFVQLISQINEADIPSEPTDPMNVPDISIQPTVTMNVTNISGQPTVPIHDVDIFVKSIDSIQKADTPVQLTDLSNKADRSPTEVFEEYQETCRIFKWVERKLDVLKMLQDSEENVYRIALIDHQNISLSDKSAVLEKMLVEIRKIISTNVPGKAGYLSKEVTRMLDMLQETAVGFLDSLNLPKRRCLGIKVLATLIQHLSASIGSKVTFQDVKALINGKRVLQLYSDVQSAREQRYVKMATVKRYLDHGIKKTQVLKRKSKSHKSRTDWTISECTRTMGVRSANENLKALTRESEDLLLKYADSINYLMNKAKSFVTMKNDSERVLNFFMTNEIQDLLKL